jgi:hypothetical protein
MIDDPQGAKRPLDLQALLKSCLMHSPVRDNGDIATYYVTRTICASCASMTTREEGWFIRSRKGVSKRMEIPLPPPEEQDWKVLKMEVCMTCPICDRHKELRERMRMALDIAGRVATLPLILQDVLDEYKTKGEGK